MGTVQVKYHLYDKSLEKELDEFNTLYEPVNVITALDHPPALKAAEERICRFCGGRAPKVSFKKDAHVIPHQLGNQLLVSDFECDKCNKLFSVYEAQLANFLGITRTILQTRGKKGLPNFFSPGNSVTAVFEEFFNVKNAIKVSAGEGLSIDADNGRTVIEYDKNPYKPLQVYKALVRIGFCMMPESDLPKYERAIKEFLLEGANDKRYAGHPLFSVYVSYVPKMHNTFAILFKRRRPGLTPAHILVLCSGQTIYRFTMPLHDDDERNYGPDFSVPLIPAFHFDELYEEHKDVNIFGIDMSSCELQQEKGSFSFSFNPAHFDKIGAYDPATGSTEKRDFDPTDVKGVILVPAGVTIQFK